MERITDHVYAATDSRGCNPGFVITSEGVVIVDTPLLPTKAVEMREEVLRKGAIRFLINTENHTDHIFGNFFFKGLCPVVGHEDIRKDFWIPRHGVDRYTFVMNVVKKDDPQGKVLIPPEKDLVVDPPSITFSARLTLYVGDHVFELIHTPGHTEGQIAVYVPREKVIFVGDTIFCECQTWLSSSDPDRWLRSLEFLKTLDADYIIPGHGPICDKGYIEKQSSFIREWVTAVAVGIAKGWSKGECVERISFVDRFPMDIGLESSALMVQQRNVERIFDFLTGKVKKFQ